MIVSDGRAFERRLCRFSAIRTVFALDAKTGKPVSDFQTGGGIAANPVPFNIDGKQCIAIAADHVL